MAGSSTWHFTCCYADDDFSRRYDAKQVICLSTSLPATCSKHDRCAEAACQTCEEVLTRSQFETLMKATSERYMSTLERMQVQMEQNVGTILSLTRQLDRQTVREPNTAKSSLSSCSHAVDLYADSPSATSELHVTRHPRLSSIMRIGQIWPLSRPHNSATCRLCKKDMLQ